MSDAHAPTTTTTTTTNQSNQSNQSSQSSQLIYPSNVKRYIDPDTWKAFKIIANFQGLSIKEATIEAIRQYVVSNQVKQVAIDIHLVQNNEKNLLTFVYNEELKTLLTELVSAKQRGAQRFYINDLKKQTLDTIKRHPMLSKDLADEVVQVFKVIA